MSIIANSAEMQATRQHLNGQRVTGSNIHVTLPSTSGAAAPPRPKTKTTTASPATNPVPNPVPKTVFTPLDDADLKVPTFKVVDNCPPAKPIKYKKHTPLFLPDEPKDVTLFFPDAPVSKSTKLPQGIQFGKQYGHGILQEVRDTQNNSIKNLSVYLPNPIVITKIFEGEYGKAEEKLELAFYDYTTNRWRSFILTRESLAKEHTITVVNKYGYSLTHQGKNSEASRLMRFLQDYEEQNHKVIPRQAMTNKLGFVNDLTDFALYSKHITIDPEGADQKLLLEKGYVTKGTDLDHYIYSVKDIVKDHSVPIFTYALSFTSVLLKVLGAPSFSVELCRNSGYGKSVLQKLALGVWGNPKSLIRQWKTTVVGIESALDFADGIITCLEDAHINTNDEILTDTFYMVFNGTGKQRGAKQGGNRRTPTFDGVLLSSTETESSNRIKLDGIRRRLLELITKAFPTKEAAKAGALALEQLHDQNYGIAGKQWIDFIIANRDSHAKWKAAYQNIVEQLDTDAHQCGFSEADLDTVMDQNRLIGVVAFTLQMINHCFGFSFNTDQVIDDIKQLVYTQLTGNSKPLVALRSIVSWAIINQVALFSASSKTGKQHGIFLPGKYLAIMPDSVEYFLKKEGFNFSVLDEWKSMGIIEFEKDGKTIPKTSIEGRRLRALRLKWSELEKYCGEGFYEDCSGEY